MDTSFTTKVTITPLKEPMGYPDNWLSLGSCFADNIGGKLRNAGFMTCLNPFGVLFNPISIATSLQTIMDYIPIAEDELFQLGSLWNHFQFSNLYSGVDRSATLQAMNKQLEEASSFFNTTNVLMLTFGTAWVYEYNKTGEVVSNCHKLPANAFRRRRLSVNEIVRSYTDLLQKLPERIRIIMTVSPVRHWKDGAHENTVSKSTLHLAIEELIARYPDSIVYFPAYELVIDELRDYRFYNDDLVHPTLKAVEYVWNAFKIWAFSSETRSVISKVEQFRNMENHRSIHPESTEHQEFKKKTEDIRYQLIQQYPGLKL